MQQLLNKDINIAQPTVAYLTHELRNPLSAALLYVTLIKDSEKDSKVEFSEYQRNLVGALENTLKDINQVIGDVLQLGRFQSRNDIVNLISIFGELKVELDNQLVNGEVKIEVLNEAERFVIGDEIALRRCFRNILLNAQQAMSSGGDIVIKIMKPSSNILRIEISDSGTGIKGINLDNLFKPFFTTKFGGTGIGLAIVADALNQHGATFGLLNNKEAGATFWCEFKLMELGS